MKTCFKKIRGNNEGSVTVEFVIGLPLLLLALVLIFEFGSLFWAHHIAVNNVRGAARFLSRAPLMEPYLTEATNIARTGNPNTATGSYDWMKKTCDEGGICIDINQSFATFSAADFNVAGKVVRINAGIPFPIPLFGLINVFSGGSTPETLTFHVIEETRYFGE